MQAALKLRERRQRLERNKLRRQHLGIKGDCLPSNVATKEIPPYPRFPPETWVGDPLLDTPKVLPLSAFYIENSCLFSIS